jgi:hypothetical protein
MPDKELAGATALVTGARVETVAFLEGSGLP